MSLADELAFTTVVELAGRIRRRELSPVEVLDATIERVEARNPSLNALVYLWFDDARAATGRGSASRRRPSGQDRRDDLAERGLRAVRGDRSQQEAGGLLRDVVDVPDRRGQRR